MRTRLLSLATALFLLGCGDRLDSSAAMTVEGKVVRLFAAVGEHRLKWGIVAWVVGTAAAAAVGILAR